MPVTTALQHVAPASQPVDVLIRHISMHLALDDPAVPDSTSFLAHQVDSWLVLRQRETIRAIRRPSERTVMSSTPKELKKAIV
eukprot:6211759-Pleurochrysis_carterae.AAC.1